MKEMTVADLIRELEEFDDDSIVRIAHQPNWPLQFTLHDELIEFDPSDPQVCTCDRRGTEVEAGCPVHDEPEPKGPAKGDSPKIVYLAEGGRVHDDSPYVPGEVSKRLGWR